MIVEGIGKEFNVALVRVWLLRPADICAECYLRAQCPEQTRCLCLVASAGKSLDPTGKSDPTQWCRPVRVAGAVALRKTADYYCTLVP
jgi:hypothetical protein